MFYASDSTFINFFGAVGLTNIDAAFAMMNGAMCGQTNTPLFLNSPTNGILSSSMTIPYTGRPVGPGTAPTRWTIIPSIWPIFRWNPNQLERDGPVVRFVRSAFRTTTLEELIEQMGLGEPERYIWTIA